MFIKNTSKLLYVVALAIVLIAVVFATANFLSIQQAEAAPNASTATTINFLTRTGVTQTVTSIVQNVRAYAYGDCYIYTVFAPTAGTSQTLTVTLQHAAIPGQWIDYGEMVAITSSTVYSGIGIVRGNYARVYATVLTTTWPVSYNVTCVAR